MSDAESPAIQLNILISYYEKEFINYIINAAGYNYSVCSGKRTKQENYRCNREADRAS